MANKRGFTKFILPIPQPRYLNRPGPRRDPPVRPMLTAYEQSLIDPTPFMQEWHSLPPGAEHSSGVFKDLDEIHWYHGPDQDDFERRQPGYQCGSDMDCEVLTPRARSMIGRTSGGIIGGGLASAKLSKERFTVQVEEV